MKHQFKLILICVGILINAVAWSQMTLPPSGNNQKSEVTQYMGLVKVTIVYSSPDVGGREIWGKLVPNGLTNLGFLKSTEQNPSPWRAGANENTTITFSHDVMVEGKPLKAGTYGLHMIPGETDWTIIFSNNSSAWGSFSYVPEEDALRVTVKSAPSEFNEFLTYEFTDRLQTALPRDSSGRSCRCPSRSACPMAMNFTLRNCARSLRARKALHGKTWLQQLTSALQRKPTLTKR